MLSYKPALPFSGDPKQYIRRTIRDCRGCRSSLSGCRFGSSGSNGFVIGFRRLRWSSCVPAPRGRSCRIVSVGSGFSQPLGVVAVSCGVTGGCCNADEVVKEPIFQTTSKKVLRSSENRNRMRAYRTHPTSRLKALYGLRLALLFFRFRKSIRNKLFKSHKV